MKERNKVVDELQKMYPSYFGKLSNEEILAGKASDAYDRLTKSIISSAKARAAMNKMVEEQGKILENEQKINDAYSRLDPLYQKWRQQKEIKYSKNICQSEYRKTINFRNKKSFSWRKCRSSAGSIRL